MDDRTLDRLIRHLAERDRRLPDDRELAEACSANRRRPWDWFCGAAAAIALLWIVNSASHRPAPYSSAAARAGILPVSVEYLPTRAALDQPRLDRLRSCSEQDVYTLVLVRGWSSECACVRWDVHEFSEGTLLARLEAGEPLEIILDVSDSPPIEQAVFLAIAQHGGMLPADRAREAALLACLNDAAPPEPIDLQPARLGESVAACLPTGVSVVRHPFVVEE